MVYLVIILLMALIGLTIGTTGLIIGSVIGVIISSALGVMPGGWNAVIIFAGIALFTIWGLNRRKS